jgi:hypothetical protein
MIRSEKTVALSLLLTLLSAASTMASPTPVPATGDLLCSVDTSATARLDTLVSSPDQDGFRSLFDGTTKGWWQNCGTPFSTVDKVNGGIFRPDTTKGYKAIYSFQRNANTGGVMETKKRYKHYDVILDYWGAWGNDGGILNRVSLTGVAYETILWPMDNGNMGGGYGQNAQGKALTKPFAFSGNDTTITIATAATGWGNITANMAAKTATTCPYKGCMNTGCASTGCTQADWRRMWRTSTVAGNDSGWNTLRVMYFGGLSTGQSATGDKVHQYSFFRSRQDAYKGTRVDSMLWVPLFIDSVVLTNTQVAAAQPNPIGLQMHSGATYVSPNWYRNIRVRELDSLGIVLPGQAPTALRGNNGNTGENTGDNSIGRLSYNLNVGREGISGTMVLTHEITVRDMGGRLLEKFSGRAGAVHYVFADRTPGVRLVEIQTILGVEHVRVGQTAP